MIIKILSDRRSELTDWFHRYTRGDRPGPHLFGIPRDDLAWSDNPTLLDLAKFSELVTAKQVVDGRNVNRPLPSSLASTYVRARSGRQSASPVRSTA